MGNGFRCLVYTFSTSAFHEIDAKQSHNFAADVKRTLCTIRYLALPGLVPLLKSSLMSVVRQPCAAVPRPETDTIFQHDSEDRFSGEGLTFAASVCFQMCCSSFHLCNGRWWFERWRLRRMPTEIISCQSKPHLPCYDVKHLRPRGYDFVACSTKRRPDTCDTSFFRGRE